MKHKFILLFFAIAIFFISFASAKIVVQDSDKPNILITHEVTANKSLDNVNNSDFWDGLDTPANINHNTLGGKQGGQTGEYYHLNLSIYNQLLTYAYLWITSSSVNSSWNQSFADTLYAAIRWGYNQTIVSNAYTDTQTSNLNLSLETRKLNVTDQRYNNTNLVNNLNLSLEERKLNATDQRYNDTILSNNLNSSKLDLTDQRYNETTYITNVNQSLIVSKLNISDQRYNETSWINLQNFISSLIGNNTYAGIIWAYNQTIEAVNDINSRFWNRSQTYNKTEIDNNLSLMLLSGDQRYNETTLFNNLNSSKLDLTDQRFNETNYITNVNNSLIVSKLNITDGRYNETGWINAQNFITSLIGNNTYQLIGNYITSLLGNGTYRKLSDTITAANISDPHNLANKSNVDITNVTNFLYNLNETTPAMNEAAKKVNKSGDIMTGNLTVRSINVTENIYMRPGGKIMPQSDSTTALNIANSSGYDFMIFDTTNKRVGIGVTPTAKLEITSGGNTNPNIQINSAEGRGIRIDKTGGGETLLYLIQNDDYNNAFLEGYGGGETPLLFKIDGNGKLLITTSTEVSGTDGHQIFLNDPATTAKGLKIGFDTTGDYGFINPVWEGTAYLDLVLAKVGGEVGIGMIPTAQFELSGSVGQKATGTTWSNPSDKRLKENITPFTDGLNVISKVNPVSYELNGLGGTIKGTKGISVIAQDILDVAPYTIGTYKAKLHPDDKEETELYRFDASALTFALINAVKEQQRQINWMSLVIGIIAAVLFVSLILERNHKVKNAKTIDELEKRIKVLEGKA